MVRGIELAVYLGFIEHREHIGILPLNAGTKDLNQVFV